MNLQNKYGRRARFYFRNIYGEPFELTPGQVDIFNAIYNPEIKRAAIKATTQYGKSEVAAMAIVLAAVERRENILIIAPSGKQASIIMGKVINHFFEHPFLTGMIEYYGRLEQLQQERSKKRITTRIGSEIMMLTAEAHTVSREARSLMGFGATMVVVDESSLIPDSMFSKILRMVGGVEGGKLIQIGNPFESNHFGRAFKQDRYHKISIDWKQALAEKRITQEFLDEAKEDMTPLDWMIFYDCKFPRHGPEDALIPKDWILNAVDQKGCEGEHKQGGLDVARFGGDKTVYIAREGGKVTSMEIAEQMDTMEVVGWVRGFLDRDKPEVLAVDVIGIGSGVYDRLFELEKYEVYPLNVGAGPTDDEEKEKFQNLRAEVFWHLRSLFRPDKNGQSQISIPNDEGLIKELQEIRYKYSSERKIKIEPKAEMKKRLGHSPDKADALALAFFNLTEMEPQMIIT